MTDVPDRSRVRHGDDAPPSPPLLESIAARRSLRAFSEQPVSDELLWVLFEATRWAPSNGNAQPWRFVVARRGTAAFGRLAETLRFGNSWAKHAPILTLVAAKTVHDSPGKPVKRNRQALVDLGLGLQNLLLQAHAEGLIGHLMDGFDRDAAGEAVGIEGPHEVAAMLALGHPGDPATLDPKTRARDERARRRDPQSTFVFQDAWGDPAPWAADATSEGDDPDPA